MESANKRRCIAHALDMLHHALDRSYRTLTTEPWRKPLSVAVGTHVALYLLILLFVGLFPGEPDAKPNFWQAMAQWDGEWYLRIARRGYEWRDATTQSSVAFFPLYPLLGKGVGLAIGNLRWGLLIVTNVSFLLFLYYLYRLTVLDFDTATAERAIIYAAVFPGAFVLAAFYAEATAFALPLRRSITRDAAFGGSPLP